MDGSIGSENRCIHTGFLNDHLLVNVIIIRVERDDVEGIRLPMISTCKLP
jgi:hypothetical protein